MKSLAWCAIGSIAFAAAAPTPLFAQRYGDDGYRGGGGGSAVDACSAAVSGEVKARFPQARHVRFSTSDTRLLDGPEVRVDGRGEFEDRNGGDSRFDFGCTYNRRTGATYALDVGNVRHAGNGGKNNDAAIAGLLLGAIVVGAVVASSKDKDKDESWSPADGVRCYAKRQQCTYRGEYSERWTRRIFYR